MKLDFKVRTVNIGRRKIIPRAEIERILGEGSLAPKWKDRSTFSIKELADILGISLWAAYQVTR